MNLTLRFNDITKTLTPIDVDGVVMFDLNEIHKDWELPTKRLPSQWRNKERGELERNVNLHVMRQRDGGTLATQVAVYAYAMWVSTDFFMAVVNGGMEKAQEVAQKVAKGSL